MCALSNGKVSEGEKAMPNRLWSKRMEMRGYRIPLRVLRFRVDASGGLTQGINYSAPRQRTAGRLAG